jgi:hypothetical protein
MPGVRRVLISLLLGLLATGTMAGGVVPGSAGAAKAPHKPQPLAPAAQAVPACALLKPSEAKVLLKQIVNDPPVTKSLYCSYEGIVKIPPATRPPGVSVTEVVTRKTVASLQALLRGGMKKICAEASPGSTCATVKKTTHLATVRGQRVIWSQTTTSDQTVTGVGTAVTERHGRLVLIVVSNVSGPGQLSLAAMGDALHRF